MKLIRKIHNFSLNMIMKAKISTKIIFAVMISVCLLGQITAVNLVNAETKYPKATQSKYVNDYAGVLDNKSTEYILAVGKELEAKTSAQAAVVVIDSLQGEPIESYTKIGRAHV